jgi:diaminopimelate epimerase
MKKVRFWKMSGSGNDFVVIDNRRGVLRGNLAAWAKRLCHRQFGIGADGLLLLASDPAEDFRMIYYNADGSRATMCGNGARCMAYFARAHGVVGNTFRFRTDAYPVGARVSGRLVQVSLAGARDYKPEMKVRLGRRRCRVAYLNTGVPHAVMFVSRTEKVDVERLGRALRFHKAFGREGANVNFVQRLGPRRIRVCTYERGVEGETLACGTGVTASAVAFAVRCLAPRRGTRYQGVHIRCVTTGGETLEVGFKVVEPMGPEPVRDVTLRGPVKVTFKGEFYA